MRFLVLIALIVLNAMSAHAHEPKVVAPGSVEEIPFPGHTVHVLSGPGETPSTTAVLELEVPPRTFGAPPHIHSLEDEHFYVLEGEVDFLSGDEVERASSGSTVVLPRGHIHGFWNDTDRPARLLLVVSPGEFAGFFDDVVARIRAENAGDPATVGRLITEAAAERGCEIRMDKVPESAAHLLPRP